MTGDVEKLLPVLATAGVEFVLIGGVAAIIHGAARLTYDVDIVYARTPENIRRMVAALRAHQPYLRGAPPGLPFIWDERTVASGLNFTLTTALGDLDLLGEVPGGGTYEKIIGTSADIEAFGVSFKCVDLKTLIRLKRAAGRPKDLEAIAELEGLAAAGDDPTGNKDEQ